MFDLNKLKIKIFADGANLQQIIDMSKLDYISGFTTNPTLMRKSGIENYMNFAREVSTGINNKPVSFEVFSDNFEEMEFQAKKLSALGSNVYVKIPVMNTLREKTLPLIKKLDSLGIKLNITAIVNPEYAYEVADILGESVPHYISIFAGRISDAGIDPVPLMTAFQKHIVGRNNLSTIWASPREVRNLLQADQIGCQVITMTYDLLDRIPSLGKDLSDFTLETVHMFNRDAQQANFEIV
jgi:transaldolase